MFSKSTKTIRFETATSAVTKTIVTGLILFCGLQSAARADETYTYTGLDFQTATGPYTLSDFVSGFFTLAAPLGDNVNLASVTPTSYSFSDGVQAFASLSPPPDVTFKISTDASGNIVGWFINLENPSGFNQISTETSPNREDLGASSGGEGLNFFDQGTWQASSSGTSPTPEPRTISWMLVGLLASGGWIKTRVSHRSEKRQPK
jgi:hypothetical protein